MFDEVFLTFIECAKRGDWDEIAGSTNANDPLQKTMTGYRSRGDAEIWIVRHDGLKRAFRFPSINTGVDRKWIDKILRFSAAR